MFLLFDDAVKGEGDDHAEQPHGNSIDEYHVVAGFSGIAVQPGTGQSQQEHIGQITEAGENPGYAAGKMNRQAGFVDIGKVKAANGVNKDYAEAEVAQNRHQHCGFAGDKDECGPAKA